MVSYGKFIEWKLIIMNKTISVELSEWFVSKMDSMKDENYPTYSEIVREALRNFLKKEDL